MPLKIILFYRKKPLVTASPRRLFSKKGLYWDPATCQQCLYSPCISGMVPTILWGFATLFTVQLIWTSSMGCVFVTLKQYSFWVFQINWFECLCCFESVKKLASFYSSLFLLPSKNSEMLSLSCGDLQVHLRQLKKRQPAVLSTFFGTLSLQLGNLFKLFNIPGKTLLNFLFVLVQTQGYLLSTCSTFQSLNKEIALSLEQQVKKPEGGGKGACLKKLEIAGNISECKPGRILQI